MWMLRRSRGKAFPEWGAERLNALDVVRRMRLLCSSGSERARESVCKGRRSDRREGARLWKGKKENVEMDAVSDGEPVEESEDRSDVLYGGSSADDTGG